MNWYALSKWSSYGYHGTDPEALEKIVREGLRPNSHGEVFFAGTEEDISSYADGIWLRFPAPARYRKRVGRGEYYTTDQPIPPQQIEYKTGPWEAWQPLRTATPQSPPKRTQQ